MDVWFCEGRNHCREARGIAASQETRDPESRFSQRKLWKVALAALRGG